MPDIASQDGVKSYFLGYMEGVSNHMESDE
jgi:hypothetical protein